MSHETYNQSPLDPNLKPLLNAAYWDGHMPGNIAACQQPTLPSGNKINTSGCSKFAKAVLQQHLGSGKADFPFETIQRGTTFDPANYEIGTVLLLDREELSATRPVGDELQAFQQKAAQERPTDLAAYLAPNTHGTTKYADNTLGLTYERQVRWGVVTPTKDGPNIIAHTGTHRTWRRAENSHVWVNPYWQYKRNIEVGTTHHQTWHAPDTLLRTNIIRICAHGNMSRQEKKGWLPTFLGKFALQS